MFHKYSFISRWNPVYQRKKYEAVTKRRKADANCSSKVSSNDNSKIDTPSTAAAITTDCLDT